MKNQMGNWTSSSKFTKLEQPLLKNLDDTYIFEEQHNPNETMASLEARIIQLEHQCNENFNKIQHHSKILRDDLQTIINNQIFLEKKIKNIESITNKF